MGTCCSVNQKALLPDEDNDIYSLTTSQETKKKLSEAISLNSND